MAKRKVRRKTKRRIFKKRVSQKTKELGRCKLNFKIKPNYWLNCVQCLKENRKFYFGSRRHLGIGVEIESNSLIVRCFKHNKNIKLYRLADEETELMPEECDGCGDAMGDRTC